MKAVKKRNRQLVRIYILLAAIIVLLLISLFILEKPVAKKEQEEKVDSEKIIKVPLVPEKRLEPKGHLYLVIDDVGHNIKELKYFLQLPMPVTFAVLPGLAFTKKSVDMITSTQHGLILHQPMEAIGGQDPGPGAIKTGMKKDEIKKILRTNINQIKGLKGVNNHMGSKVTSDKELMAVILDELKGQKLFYLDSKTSPHSRVTEAGKEIGFPVMERSIFLDNSKDREKIIEALNSGIEIAKKHGHAVMIGHIWTAELVDIIQEFYPAIMDDELAFSLLSDFYLGVSDDENTWD